MKTVSSRPQEPEASLLKIRDLDISDDREVYITGSFYGNHEINDKILYDTTRQADNFLAILNDEAEIQHVFQTYNTTTDVKSNGENLILGGWFTDHMCLNESCIVESKTVKGSEIYLAKMSNSGKVDWFLNSEGEGSMTLNAIETNNNDTYLGGSLRGKVSINNKEYSTKQPTPFLMKIDNEGEVQMMKTFEGNILEMRNINVTDAKILFGGHYIKNQKLQNYEISLSEEGNSGILFFQSVYNK